MCLAFTQDHNVIESSESPYWFYGYRDGALRLDIEYVESGRVQSLYELAHFETYDSCFVDIHERELVIWHEYLALDSIQIINKIDSLQLEGMLDRIFW